MRVVLLSALFLAIVYAAPSANLEDTLKALQQQIAALEQSVENKPNKESNSGSYASLDEASRNIWQPAKRMVAWQPMKRAAADERAPLVHAIEARLQDVLRAGERLGISAEEVLADLRYRNHIN